MGGTRRSGRLVVLLTALALLLTAPGPAWGAAQPPPPVKGRSARASVTAVTLVTGDRVLLRELGGGRRTVSVTPAARTRPAAFQTWSVGKDSWVLPSDVRGLVGRVLDPALFNVTALAGMGYDDAHAPSLPLIVQHARTGRAALTAAGLRPVRELASLRATAVRQPRTAAGGLRAALTAGGRARAAAPAGFARVWLDRRFHTTALDRNLTQIGAPTAWGKGLTGRGVRVAVLDTGIDATHPDLAGKVVAAANFSDSPSVADHFGHGTHVAGIAAGTGAKSGGRRKGVGFGPACSTARSSTTPASAPSPG